MNSTVDFEIHPQSFVDSWNAIFCFGKHRGETVEQVFKSDLSYLLWLIDEEAVNFDENVAARIEHERGTEEALKQDLLREFCYD